MTVNLFDVNWNNHLIHLIII